MTDPIPTKPKSDSRSVVLIIVLGYMIVGALYACFTPDWQVPDEPAHYNYIRQLAESGNFPRLEPGDYDHPELERMVSEGFPDAADLHDIEYEDHQPPLYYLLSVPVYLLFDGSLLALRIFSLVLGLGIVLSGYAIARRVFPDHAVIAAGTAAFVAFVPQHVYMMAGVNNDSLAGLLVGAILLLSIRMAQVPILRHRELLLSGLVLGLGLLTKATVYPMVGVVLVALVGRWWMRQDSNPPQLLAEALTIVLPAVLIAAPWWIRNIVVYGWPDWLGLIRHAAVVEGQPLTSQWISEHGSGAWLNRGIELTFQSFWGQFGWMSVAMDFRVYFGLALATALAVLSFFWPSAWSEQKQKSPVIHLLFTQFILVLSAYLAYNVVFVQHQGRYLFPAIIPIALMFAVGFFRLLRGALARHVAIGLVCFLALLVTFGWLHSDIKGWYALLTAAVAAGLLGLSRLPEPDRFWAYAVPFGMLFLVNFHAVFQLLPALE
jgi:4-amino-4-deoxy-L-arabinose transferase-like glycosyltransferase